MEWESSVSCNELVAYFLSPCGNRVWGIHGLEERHGETEVLVRLGADLWDLVGVFARHVPSLHFAIALGIRTPCPLSKKAFGGRPILGCEFLSSLHSVDPTSIPFS